MCGNLGPCVSELTFEFYSSTRRKHGVGFYVYFLPLIDRSPGDGLQFSANEDLGISCSPWDVSSSMIIIESRMYAHQIIKSWRSFFAILPFSLSQYFWCYYGIGLQYPPLTKYKPEIFSKIGHLIVGNKVGFERSRSFEIRLEKNKINESNFLHPSSASKGNP